MRRAVGTISAALLAVAFLAPASGAYADEVYAPAAAEVSAGEAGEVTPNAGVPGHYTYRMVNKTSTKNVVNFGQGIGRCSGSSTVTCNIARTESASVQISASLGATKSWVSGQLGVSVNFSVSTSISCSASVRPGKILVAYPYATRYRYQLQKIVAQTGRVIETSGYLYSYKPNGASAYCRVETL